MSDCDECGKELDHRYDDRCSFDKHKGVIQYWSSTAKTVSICIKCSNKVIRKYLGKDVANNWQACFTNQSVYLSYLEENNDEHLRQFDSYIWQYDKCEFHGCGNKWSTKWGDDLLHSDLLGRNCRECDIKGDLFDEIHIISNKINGKWFEEEFVKYRDSLWKRIGEYILLKKTPKESNQDIYLELLNQYNNLTFASYKTQVIDKRIELQKTLKIIHDSCIEEGHPGYYCGLCEIKPNHSRQ